MSKPRLIQAYSLPLSPGVKHEGTSEKFLVHVCGIPSICLAKHLGDWPNLLEEETQSDLSEFTSPGLQSYESLVAIQ